MKSRRLLLATLPLALVGGALLANASVEAGVSQDLVRLSKGFTSVYAIRGEQGVVLVDAHNAGEEDWILKELAREGIAPEDIRLILLTHGHQDHAGSAAALAERTGAPVAIGAMDLHLVDGSPPEGDISEVATDWRGRALGALIDTTFPPFQPDLLVEERLDLAPYGVEGEAFVVGGHTAGSLVVRLPSGEVLSGDLVRGSMFARGKPTLHFFHEDLERAHAALGELLTEQPTALCSAHDRCLAPQRVERWLERR